MSLDGSVLIAAAGDDTFVRFWDVGSGDRFPRRTMATGMQNLGVSPDAIKAVLAHTPTGDVTHTHYAQSTLAREMREALTRWQSAVAQMVRGDDPFAFQAEDAAEMERRILGDDHAVRSVTSATNVVPMKRSA